MENTHNEKRKIVSSGPVVVLLLLCMVLALGLWMVFKKSQMPLVQTPQEVELLSVIDNAERIAFARFGPDRQLELDASQTRELLSGVIKPERRIDPRSKGCVLGTFLIKSEKSDCQLEVFSNPLWLQDQESNTYYELYPHEMGWIIELLTDAALSVGGCPS